MPTKMNTFQFTRIVVWIGTNWHMTKKCFINLWPDLGIFPGIGVKEYCMTDVLPKFHCVPSAIVGDMALLPYPFQSRPCYHTFSAFTSLRFVNNTLFSSTEWNGMELNWIMNNALNGNHLTWKKHWTELNWTNSH